MNKAPKKSTFAFEDRTNLLIKNIAKKKKWTLKTVISEAVELLAEKEGVENA